MKVLASVCAAVLFVGSILGLFFVVGMRPEARGVPLVLALVGIIVSYLLYRIGKM